MKGKYYIVRAIWLIFFCLSFFLHYIVEITGKGLYVKKRKENIFAHMWREQKEKIYVTWRGWFRCNKRKTSSLKIYNYCIFNSPEVVKRTKSCSCQLKKVRASTFNYIITVDWWISLGQTKQRSYICFKWW
jgi:hypothetical protein